MTVGATLVASLLATLDRPTTWPLALATFLLRGGILLVLAPIVVLPSAVSVGNVLTPLLSTVVFQGVTPSIVLLLTGAVGAALLWLIGAGLVAAAAESALVLEVGADDETWPAGRPPRDPRPVGRAAWRVLVVRLIAHVPLAIALSWGAVRIVTVAYRELTVPSDVEVALVLRVAGGATDAVVVVLVAWLVGETVGAIAARRVVLLGEGVVRGLRGGVARLVWHPLRTVVLAALPVVPLGLVLAGVGLAGSATWNALRSALSLGGEPLMALLLLLALVSLFAGGLLLIGVTSAWRAAIWTVDVAGTFGATQHGPEGPWIGAGDSGTLGDLRPRGVDPDTR
jgi:hypothetical protein